MNRKPQSREALNQRIHELERERLDYHVALKHIPPSLLSAIAELVREIEQPTSHSDDLGVRVHDESENEGVRTNPRAIAALKDIRKECSGIARRLWNDLERLGAVYIGDEAGGSVGRLDSIFHGSNSTNTRKYG
jgi:hypothetical protein